MDDQWARFISGSGYSVEPPEIQVKLGDGRLQRVRVEEFETEFLLTSIVAKRSVVESMDRLPELVWSKNRSAGVAGFRLDDRGRLIGECHVPKIGMTPEEFQAYVTELAVECDRLEYLLTGKDSEWDTFFECQADRNTATMDNFTFEHNRSERALQVELLRPVLASHKEREALLSNLKPAKGGPISIDEASQSLVMSFVWVLRDAFSFERNAAVDRAKRGELNAIAALRQRWCEIMELGEWATNPSIWSVGKKEGLNDFPVHPCHRLIGWTESNLRSRLGDGSAAEISQLIKCRKTMNTECDCLIQTPKRIIVIECKGETSFLTEQRDRQRRLFRALCKLLPREQPLVYVELAWTARQGGVPCWHAWDERSVDGFESMFLRWSGCSW
jgi:hypothetical protein